MNYADRLKFRLDPFPRIPRIALPIWWAIYLCCGFAYLIAKFVISIVSLIIWLFQPNKKKIKRFSSLKYEKKERNKNIRK